MTAPDRRAEAVIEASARMLGIGLGEADPGVVKLHLETAARMAALLDGFALADEAEPAPVFAA